MTTGNAFTVRVSVPFDYPVHLTSDAFDPESSLLADVLARKEPGRRHRVLVVVDRGLHAAQPTLLPAIERYAAAHAPRLELVGQPLLATAGEDCKNDPAEVSRVHAEMARVGLDKQSFCLIVGGGAVLDMAGFAAATAHRGVRVVRMPSTVLSQCDSGVGVKNGVNAFGMKNFVGAFAPPFAVINDRQLLSTLSPRDCVAGMAEAVKVALVRDGAFFEWMERHSAALAALEPEPLNHLIERCARLHTEHIQSSGDPFEFGSSRPLDFGHWAAHKLESMTAHELRHGEAVAIGIALDSRYSAKMGMLAQADADRICRLLTRLGFSLRHPALFRRDGEGRFEVLRGLAEFREHLGGELTVSMLEAPGRARNVHTMEEHVLEECLAQLRASEHSGQSRGAPGREAHV